MANGFNRRGFVGLILGGVVGIHATPVVWKLMDDVAIWTQNWSWVPVPKDGEVASTTTFSPICQGGCGVRVRLVNPQEGEGDQGGIKLGGLGVKVEGDPNHPVTRGGVCPTCLSSLQYLYDDALRVKTPLGRLGKSGPLVTISWDEALGRLVKVLKKLREGGQAHTVAALTQAGGGTLEELAAYFLTAYGSPNFLRMPSGRDSTGAAAAAMLGAAGVGFDFQKADFVLSLGAGLLEGFGDEVWSRRAYADLRRLPNKPDVPLWMTDARASNTASAADKWLPIKPGTEGVLALGLCHLVAAKGAKVPAGVTGLAEFTLKVLPDYAPDKVLALTGLKALGFKTKILSDLAAALLAAERPLVIWGRGKGNQPDGLYNSMAALALNALIGAVGRTVVPVADPPLAKFPKAKLDDVARKGLARPRADGALPPLSQWRINGLWEAAFGGRPYPINLLLVFGANPAFAAPDTGAVRAAFRKIGTVVCFTPLMDETARAADLVLPAPFYLEAWQDAYTPLGFPKPVYNLGSPLFKVTKFKSKHPGDVLIQVARRLGGTVADSFDVKTAVVVKKKKTMKTWQGFEDVLKYRVAGLAGKGRVGSAASPSDPDALWKALVKNAFWVGETSGAKAPKVELVSSLIARLVKTPQAAPRIKGLAQPALAALPHYEPVRGKDNRYPFLLVPYELSSLREDGVPFSPFMTKIMDDNLLRGHESFVEINPAMGHKLGLSWGDRVHLVGPGGSIQARVDLTERAMPGFVFAPVGLGHTAFDHFIKGKGANTLDVVTVTPDPLSGLPVWPASRIRIVKA
jgi:anaerobic selenocysteine-containing dehydrogenase